MSQVNNILSDLVATIRSINGPAGGFVNSITYRDQVEDKDYFGSEVPEDRYPHFGVVITGSTREKEPGTVRAQLKLQIQTAFRLSSQLQIASWLSDVEVALSQDVTRGGHAIETWIDSIDYDSGNVDPDRLYMINVQVEHLYPFGEP